MKVKLLLVGKTLQSNPEDILFEVYKKRLSIYTNFELVIIKPQKGDKALAIQKEGKKIMDHIESSDYVCLLDEKGKEFTSEAFSTQLQMWFAQHSSLVFIIGGAYGFSKEVYSKFKQRMSLSKMTIPHSLAKVFFIEQLYRAFTISIGHPYHH